LHCFRKGEDERYLMSEVKLHGESLVYVVDDDPQTRSSVAELIHSFGFQVKIYETPEEFLENVDSSRPGCVVLDMRMPGLDGLEVHQRLISDKIPVSVIVLTAHAETPITVRSLRNGAVAVLDKPFREDELWGYVQEGLQRSEKELFRLNHLAMLENRLKRLSLQDREVLKLMLEGVKNRTIAKRLEVSLRTVENRRRKVFEVMQADSVAELSRMMTEFEHGLLPKQNAHETWIKLPHERIAC